MTLNDRLKKVAVLGAGGKMGSGISLLLAREMTLQKLRPENAHKDYQLTLMDVNPLALEGLQSYLTKQAKKYVQKNAEKLLSSIPGSSSLEAIEKQFVETLRGIVNPVTELGAVKESLLVFEAILENIDLKVTVFSQLKSSCPEETYFFSNTSSIPLKELGEKVGLEGRIIGFHFYNPPAIQKLVELIIPLNIKKELPPLSRELGKRLGKIIIPSNDVAGFIGNGHFTRDGLYGIAEAEKLSREHSFVEAIYIVNKISKDFLIRPMGIFQLIDYVGLDVFQSILKIMNPHFNDENLHSELIDVLVTKGVKGGQYSDGNQKDGFFKYQNGQPSAVYNLDNGQYLPFSNGEWQTLADEKIGPLPKGHSTWKDFLKDKTREESLSAYFTNLISGNSFGAQLAAGYLKKSKSIGQLLISGGAANTADDVNGVLMNGFFHLYGPINNYV